MAGQAPTTRHEFEAEVTRRAWEDKAFRQALIEDPKATIERELGVRVPEGVALTVVEESPTNRYLVLPPRPSGGDGEISDAELEGSAGGVVIFGATASGCLF